MNIRMMRAVPRFAASREGATAIEYSMIAAGLAVAIVAGIALLDDAILAMFNQIAAAFSG